MLDRLTPTLSMLRNFRPFLASISVVLCFSGCADFSAIRTFSKNGSTVATAAKKDVDVFSSACQDLATEAAILARADMTSVAPTPVRPDPCLSVKSAVETASGSLSIDLLVKYHEALSTLAGDENWTVAAEVEALGTAAKALKSGDKALAKPEDVDKYQAAFSAIADLIVSSMRERAAKRLLGQPLDWPAVLKPLRFWYGGETGASPSMYSAGCEVVSTQWLLARNEMLDFARCDVRTPSGVPRCEPLTAAVRATVLDGKAAPFVACAAIPPKKLPEVVAARVRLIDDWIAANEQLRKDAFSSNPQLLLERLSKLREQANTIRKTFD